MVKVEVDDVNDNVPVFSPSMYNMTLQTSHPVGQTFLMVRATDLDSGDFGQVEYMVRSGNSQGTFQLDRQTGELSLSSPLGLSPALHTLLVQARDGAGRLPRPPRGGEGRLRLPRQRAGRRPASTTSPMTMSSTGTCVVLH